jgi:hypothetical protein
MTNTAANVAAVAAAFRDISVDGVAPLPIGGPAGSRRNTSSKSAAARAAIVDSLLSPPASLPAGRSHLDKREMHESAIDDDPQDGSADEDAAGKLLKARARRASDGQPLTKERRKSNRAELRCDKCGKGYKHSSCLTKHLFVVPLFPLSPRVAVRARTGPSPETTRRMCRRSRRRHRCRALLGRVEKSSVG